MVKAPTLITDDGVVLMESSLILEHIAEIAPAPADAAGSRPHEKALRQIGLALAACEKSVSIIYECNLGRRKSSTSPGWTGSRGQLAQPPIARWKRKRRPTGSPARI